jgi:hypothetical protein
MTATDDERSHYSPRHERLRGTVRRYIAAFPYSVGSTMITGALRNVRMTKGATTRAGRWPEGIPA